MKCLFCGGKLGTEWLQSLDPSRFCINRLGSLWTTYQVRCCKRNITIKDIPSDFFSKTNLDICSHLIKIVRSSILI